MRIAQVPSEELKKLSLSMGKLIRQGLGGTSGFRLDSQSEHRSKPLASVSLPSDAKDSIRQVGRNGLPKGPASELLGEDFLTARVALPRNCLAAPLSAWVNCATALSTGVQKVPRKALRRRCPGSTEECDWHR